MKEGEREGEIWLDEISSEGVLRKIRAKHRMKGDEKRRARERLNVMAIHR